jgi:hypothetical protein
MNEMASANRQSLAQGCLAEMEWLGVGFVMPCASLAFYRHAARRRVIRAVIFFLLFALVITSLSTINVGVTLFPLQRDIRQAFERGEIPQITIRDGIATVDAEQPFVLVDDDRMIVVLDTTGTYTRIDRSRYNQGFLLTRTTLHMLDDDGDYQEIPLETLHEMFGVNPIVINANTTANIWLGFSAISTVAAFVFIAIWHMLVRFVYVTMIGLAIWGIVALFRRNTGFAPVLIAGLYATVPAMYAHYLLGLLGIHFIFLYTFLLLGAWAIGIGATLARPSEGFIGGERPLRGWRALLGVPMLLLFAVDLAVTLPDEAFGLPVRALVIWAAALFTFVMLLTAGLWTARKWTTKAQEESEAIVQVETPGMSEWVEESDVS